MNERQPLLDLGQTPQAVVQSLVAAGIKGVRNDSCECPLARHLKAQGLVLPSVTPGLTEGRFYFQDGQKRWGMALPEPCNVVANNFDAGAYPELEET